MPRFARIGLGFASAWLLVLGSRAARAQTTTPITTTTTTATVAASQQVQPNRYLNYGTSASQFLGPSTRPVNLNPLGISYNDCITDQTLQFNVLVSGFTGGQDLQVWATRSGDCSADTARGASGAVAATCWLVNQGITGRSMLLSQTVSLAVRVQDLVGPQNAPPFPPVMVNEGPSVCLLAQSTFVAVPMDIWFVPVLSNGLIGGTAYDYSIPGGTDLVGPPAPASVKVADGDTLSVVNWVPNADSDTGGYDVFIDPSSGGAVSDASVKADASSRLFCPDTGAAALMSTEAATQASPDASTDAEVASLDAGDAAASDAASTGPMDGATSDDSGCYLVNTGGSAAGSTSGSVACFSAILASGVVQDGGGVVVESEASVDDAGDDATALQTTINEGSGGISTVPCAYGIGNLCNPSNLTVTGETDSTFTVKGLTNGSTYTIAMAAVDAFGNVGPPSPQACSMPKPVNDFWKIYRGDGGDAGGGFCALEAVGAPAGSTVALMGAGALALAGVRRRRSKQR